MRLEILLSSVCAIAAAGCKDNPLFCQGHPMDPRCMTIDTQPACSGNTDCTLPTPVCDVAGTKTCVQCLAPDQTAACSGTSPACGDDHMCRPCSAHAECLASKACLPDGSCADMGQVAYVDPAGTDNNNCTLAAPCTKVDKALQTDRPYVKLTGATDEGGTVVIDNQNVALLAAPGAKLARTSNGVVLEVRGTSQVAIYDLEISGGSGAQGIGISIPAGGSARLSLTRAQVINNAGGGISAQSGTLSATRSTISGNQAGGISINGAQFDLTNNIVAGNGGGASVFGGLRIDGIVGAGTRRMDFNTITANVGPAMVHTGVSCGTVLTPLTFSSNIVYANIVSGGGTQVGGSANCMTRFSDVGPGAVGGSNNIDANPMFVNPAQNNFHLMPGSLAKDAADPAATLNIDIDGDARPQGTARDMGADEIK